MERYFIGLMLIFCAAILVGCASRRTVMHSWIGHTDDELNERWGKPQQLIDSGDEGRIAVYIIREKKPHTRKSSYCDYKFKSSCILTIPEEYNKWYLFYISALGRIYKYKIVKPEKIPTGSLH